MRAATGRREAHAVRASPTAPSSRSPTRARIRSTSSGCCWTPSSTPTTRDPFARTAYRAIGPSLRALCPGSCRGVSADPAADLAAARRAAAGSAPMRGAAYDVSGRSQRADADAAGAQRPDVRRRLRRRPLRAGVPAAVRAALRGDAAPLLRLMRDRRRPRRAPRPAEFSSARYAAVCEETPLPWDPAAPPSQRERAGPGAGRRARPGAFRPFDFAVVRADEIDLCLHWPGAGAPSRRPRRRRTPRVPTLILQGGEDLRTPPAGSARGRGGDPRRHARGRARRRPCGARGATRRAAACAR